MPSVGFDKKKLLHAANRRTWRDWLRKHYRTKHEIWLVFFKKHTGRQRISYNDAVEEALCFGWIDSTVRSIDEKRFAQRFSARRSGSSYSQSNRERLQKLIRKHKVAKDILAELRDKIETEFEISHDILMAIKANRDAWKNFRRFSRSYVRIRIAFIEGARNRPMEFAKRLRYFISRTEKNRQFGFGGIEKYY